MIKVKRIRAVELPAEKCESCERLLIYGENAIVWTLDEIPLCKPCAKELSKEST